MAILPIRRLPKSVRKCAIFGSDGHQPLCRAYSQSWLRVQAFGYRCHPHHVRGLHAGAVAGRTKIQLGDLGSFYISINSTGAASAQEFNPAIHIRRLNVNWTCGQRFGELLEEAEFNLVATRSAARAVVKALKAGKTTVDLTGATGGGEDAGGGSNPGGGSDGDQGENPLG